MELVKNLVSQVERKISRLPQGLDIPDEAELEKYRYVQQLAYRCAVEISQLMREGWTERKTADLMDTFLRDHGVRAFFHRSFAWFGDHSRFQGFDKYRDFLPSKRRLRADDIVILDTAPIWGSHIADVGYTCALDPQNPQLLKAREVLMQFRRDLPELFASQRNPAEICEHVDRQIQDLGLDNCHAMYPFSVLGHRLPTTPFGKLPGLVIPFGWQAYWALISRGLYNQLFGPHHEGKKTGLWAIEPHLGADGYGFKFEEILVVEEDRAYWLDDSVPHNLDAQEHP